MMLDVAVAGRLLLAERPALYCHLQLPPLAAALSFNAPVPRLSQPLDIVVGPLWGLAQPLHQSPLRRNVPAHWSLTWSMHVLHSH